ncbi:MAG TPA: aldo/keto reductase [Minicystis sp.]|nr:aldo/keto reductase [Minicystis sp.]
MLGSGLALAACNGKGGGRAGGAPEGPQPGAPKEGDVKLPVGAAMPMRRLGKTGVNVSLVGLGGFHIGVPKDEKEGIRIVHAALDHGVNFLDNCWDYHDGDSEQRVGKALLGGYRKKAFVMTKLDGRTKKAAADQLERSLRRLRTDVIDLVQIHEVIRASDPGRVFAEGGAIEALVDARQAGKIRFIGFTGHKDPDIHLAMLRAADAHGFRFDTVQMPLNPMDAHYRSFRENVLPVLVERDVGVLGMKPLGSGLLLKSGAVDARECLRYAMSLPTSVVITGCDTMGVLEQALDVALRFEPMTEDEKSALLARTAAAAAHGRFEQYKTTERFDGTAKHPGWLEHA